MVMKSVMGRILLLGVLFGSSSVWADVVDVVIIAGQSNAVGAGYPAAVRAANAGFVVPNENVRYCYSINDSQETSDWVPLGPMADTWIGAEMMLGHVLESHLPDRDLAIMKFARNGSSLGCSWNPGGCPHPAGEDLYARLKDWMTQWRIRLEAEGKTCRFAALVWIQGESDMASAWMAETYESRMSDLIYGIRAHAEVPTLPVIMAMVHPRAMDYNGVHQVHAAMRRLGSSDPAVSTVTCRDLPLKGDLVHFTADSFVWLGGRIADALLAMDAFGPTAIPQPPAAGVCCVNFDCQELASWDCLAAQGVWLGEDGSCHDCPTACDSDTDRNGVINIDDLLNVIANYGLTCG